MLNEALRLIRVFHNMKAIDLADKLGVSPSHISELESGKKKPSMELIQKYSETFKLPASSIMFFAEEIDERRGIKAKVKAGLKEKILAFMQAVEDFDEKHR
jgi:transcriptional regulator with XRE-family HTH domain